MMGETSAFNYACRYRFFLGIDRFLQKNAGRPNRIVVNCPHITPNRNGV